MVTELSMHIVTKYICHNIDIDVPKLFCATKMFYVNKSNLSTFNKTHFSFDRNNFWNQIFVVIRQNMENNFNI